jgi:hypothetical protein
MEEELQELTAWWDGGGEEGLDPLLALADEAEAMPTQANCSNQKVTSRPIPLLLDMKI